MLIALTGGIGSGKSTVAEIWRKLGASIVDADELAREVVAPGSKLLAVLVDEFGPQLINPDGSLRREELASLIFADSDARLRVESLMHPEIQRLAAERIAAARSPVVYVIPLLAETKSPLKFDAIVNIAVPENVRSERLMKLRGLSHGEVNRRMRAQASEAERASAANFQLDGNCSLAELGVRATRLFQSICAGQG